MNMFKYNKSLLKINEIANISLQHDESCVDLDKICDALNIYVNITNSDVFLNKERGPLARVFKTKDVKYSYQIDIKEELEQTKIRFIIAVSIGYIVLYRNLLEERSDCL